MVKFRDRVACTELFVFNVQPCTVCPINTVIDGANYLAEKRNRPWFKSTRRISIFRSGNAIAEFIPTTSHWSTAINQREILW